MAPRTRRHDIASLLDENQRLRLQLKSCESRRQQAEKQVVDLQGRMHQAEMVAAQQLRRKEAEWMAEYDRSVKALLEIVKHHEDEKAQLQTELERLRAAATVVPPSIIKMTRSTQTETQRPVKATVWRNSVRFAKEEDNAVSDKEERPYIDAKTKASIARMQQLFEQLQVSSDKRDVNSVDRPKAAVNKGLDAGPSHNGNGHLSGSFTALVLERLGDHQTESSTVRRRRRATTATSEDSKRKTIETQTNAIPVPKQEMLTKTLQQDLEERNRLLHERLDSQQKVLDHLLRTKLEHANGSSEQYNPVSSTLSDFVRECAVNDHGEAQNKSEHHVPTANAAGYKAPSGGVRIESVADIEERRPLSPATA